MEDKKTYSTKEIATLAGMHPNTVRLYEKIGFITAPEREKNGYRVFTELQLKQCILARRAMRAEVLQNGLRKKAVEIVRLCADGDMEKAFISAGEYKHMICIEIDGARRAVNSVEGIIASDKGSALTGFALKRKEAAQTLGVTTDTLRNWELNGLIKVRRSENGYRVYESEDLERLNIIRTLRCAGYSLSSILRLLNCLDGKGAADVGRVLETPGENEDIVSVCDRLITSLEATLKDAELISVMLVEIKEIL